MRIDTIFFEFLGELKVLFSFLGGKGGKSDVI
jgi:hypothetical protein